MMTIWAAKRPPERDRSRIVSAKRVGVLAGFAAFVAATAVASALPPPSRPSVKLGHLTAPAHSSPWIEGVDPVVENELFYATYGALQNHNVLKVYAFSAGGYESAAIRFSGRVPHQTGDLTLAELAKEAVVLIHTAFDEFPEIQHVDVWATVPVAQSQATRVENTVFSVSADRDVYERVVNRGGVTDIGFLSSFGRIWVAPQVPR
jgi:hypothetical protein